MRVAAIYDIHGNLPALEAVLDEVRTEGVDQLVVGGDIVPGPMPRESVAALLELPVPVRFIQGNGERDILALDRGEALSRVPKPFHEVMRWVADALSPEQRSAFAGWPLTCELGVPGLGTVLFCHATPRDDNEIFTRITPEDRLRPIFEATGAAVVVCGHTHMQFDRRVGAVRVVNAGSVGMPFGGPGAYWALLGSGFLELRHTPYDLAAAAERIGATAYPQASTFEVLRPPPESRMLDVFEAAALRERPAGGPKMRKRIIDPVQQDTASRDQDWLNLEELAEVEVTSEDAAHPIEAALLPGSPSGWRAAGPGPQTIRLLFGRPQRLRRIRVSFEETRVERTQEYVLRWSADGGQSFRDIVRQQWNFSPEGATRQTEDHHVDLPAVTVLEFGIVPDTSRGAAVASLAELRLA